MVNSLLISKSLLIEVENGVDADGEPKYVKKSFGKLKNNAVEQDVYDVAVSIKDVLGTGSGKVLIDSVNSLING